MKNIAKIAKKLAASQKPAEKQGDITPAAETIGRTWADVRGWVRFMWAYHRQTGPKVTLRDRIRLLLF